MKKKRAARTYALRFVRLGVELSRTGKYFIILAKLTQMADQRKAGIARNKPVPHPRVVLACKAPHWQVRKLGGSRGKLD